MALATDFLEDFGSKKLGWCFNVYLIWLWEVPDKNNEERSIVLIWSSKIFRLLVDNPSTIVRIGQISSGSSVRYVDEIKRGKSTVKTIEEVAKSTEKCDVWIVGTIVVVNATKDSWHLAIGEEEYLPTLNNMLERRLLFRINMKSTNINQRDRVYTVSNICDDKDILKSNHAKEITEDASLNNNDSLEDAATSVRYKTPAKNNPGEMRSGENFIDDQKEEGQLSINKFSRKGVKRQKNQNNIKDN
ncbi:hypothetical protein PIB30_000620 [Stylosanthes scabra]|uniref:Uncharacterized protein n=1 Tax=Stylosanthes scabra TaxID=79078 RepID=A0ABU6XZ51_9FABA|nr:hypothetical protein [Stylosanthes scabra]